MEEQYGFCNLSLVPIRAEASDKSEMLSQLLFGDCFKVLDANEKWVRILTGFDGYEGWIDSKQYSPVNYKEYQRLNTASNILGPGVCHSVIKQSGTECLHLVAGSSIPELAGSSFKAAGEEYVFSEGPGLIRSTNFRAEVEQLAKFFLHTPYLWGGKSLFGIDCSGFSQIVYKMAGLAIKRDAWQQAEQGWVVNFLQEAKTGDLAFFDNDEGRIVHVGIMLEGQKIIHASGRVKIDPIDDEGIYSLDLGRHTHKLRIIKRYTD